MRSAEKCVQQQRLNGELLKEVDCFKYLGGKWQWMEDVKGMWYTE